MAFVTDAPTPDELAQRVDEIAQALMVANVGDNQSLSDLAWHQARDDVLSSAWFTEHVVKTLAAYAAMFATHVERLHAQQTGRPFIARIRATRY